MGQFTSPDDVAAVEAELRELRDAMVAAEIAQADVIAAVHPSHRRSAANLVHYVELRRRDVRVLQVRLATLGLSSLGRCEPFVLATIEAVLDAVTQLRGGVPPTKAAGVAMTEGHELLARHANRLLGRAPAGRSTRIMVTVPSEAADDARVIDSLIACGMDLARVNCAHDGPDAWGRMITNVRSAVRPNGRRCLVAMDLGGPKLRTGPLLPGPRVVRIAPLRDHLGVVVEAARIRLITSSVADRSAGDDRENATIDVPIDDEAWIARRRLGDRLHLRDSRDAERRWDVVEVFAGGCLAVTTQTSYVSTGLKLECRTGGIDAAVIGELPEVEQAHRVYLGDQVVLTRSLAPVAPTHSPGTHHIGCTLPEAFAHARPGQRVWLDDGKIGGTIDRVDVDEIAVTVTDVRKSGVKLKAGKGINLPETDLHLDALTAQDLEDLDVVARHADVVNVSFVRCPDDVAALQRELDRRDAGDIGIVLKIENVAAFAQLPELLLTAMRSPHVGVMIARGDLAVEVGFERLAEVQEEILWACEAAHVPVIWATQVLDTLARTGRPSRAEVTDAAMADRAECVMLNKGPHITEAIGTLDSILSRMQEHQDKKRSLLRRLHAWDQPTGHG